MNTARDRFQFKRQYFYALLKAFKLVWGCARGWTVANFALQVLQGTLPLLTLYLTKLIVDGVTEALNAPDKWAAFRPIGGWVILMAAIYLAQRLLSSVATLIQEQQSWKVSDHVHNILHSKSVAVDLQYYENSTYYDTLHMAQREAPYRPQQVVSILAQLVQNGVSLVAMVALLMRFHWAVALFLLPVVAPGVLVRLYYSRKFYDLRKQQSHLERQATYYDWMLIGQHFAKEVRLFDLGKLFIHRYRRIRQRWRRERLHLMRKQVSRNLMAELISALLLFVGLAFVVVRAISGNITMGDLVMYYQAFQRSQNALKTFLSNLTSLYENSLFLNHFYTFLELQPKICEPIDPKPVPQPMVRGIEVKGLGFSYPNSTRKVLKEVSFNIRSGEHVALVGENGSGKTTLIKLLCRLYEPDNGSITLDNIALSEFSPGELRRHFSIVFQDYVNYYLSARENIWMGNVKLALEDKAIIRAAQETGADSVIQRLPNGYDTRLGKWFENGEELSVGEWQKIALARALVRDAQIVILDEPTSGLDAKAEYRIFRLFQKMTSDKTAIFISHRLASARLADRILVLENGSIVEDGSHEQLLKLDGAYARLYNLQAQHYQDV
ncbi:ATP-binding cassette domain-containing protein [candidate division KSB1 bacterium]|nr:ATP-binding cassette domain-containing protein [candidate division KSB1 bacterium]